MAGSQAMKMAESKRSFMRDTLTTTSLLMWKLFPLKHNFEVFHGHKKHCSHFVGCLATLH